jgi:hypothetical protein
MAAAYARIVNVRGRPLGFGVLLASSTCGVLAACTVFSGLHLPAGDGDATTMSMGDGETSDTSPPDPCVHAVVPPKPAQDDAPGVDVGTMVFALQSYTFDANVGLDLDGVCTCDTRPNTAHGGSPSCAPSPSPSMPTPTPLCDVDGGIDNEVAALESALIGLYPAVAPFNKLIDGGRRTSLIQIAGYNGKANDPDVAVGMFDAAGIRSKGCPNSTFDMDHGVYTPGWCGLDRWDIDSRSAGTAGGKPIANVFGKGYVANHKLVVLVPTPVPLPGSGSSSLLAIMGAVIVADLVASSPDGSAPDPSVDSGAPAFALTNGFIAGTLTTGALLGWVGMQNVTDTDGGSDDAKSLCHNAGLFSQLKQTVCPNADVTTTTGFNASAPCNAMSSALSFVALPALIGDVHLQAAASGSCDPNPDGGNPFDASVTYTCP